MTTAMRALFFILFLVSASSSGSAADLPFHAGVVRISVQDQTPFEAIVWYPTGSVETAWQAGPYSIDASRNAPVADRVFPVVILSHGHAGSPFGHRELAARLAREGFVVIAPTHVGDSAGSLAGYEQGRALTDRPRQAQKAIDATFADTRLARHMNRARMGMIGFSAGGYTTLVLAGAEADFRLAAAYCAAHPQDLPSCGDRKGNPSDRAQTTAGPTTHFTPAYTLKAIVVMDPLAIMFDAAALTQVRMPVLLYRPADTAYLSAEPNAQALLAKLPAKPREVVVPGRHFVFLDPCPASLVAQAPLLCQDAPGVDRAAIHRRMEDEIAAFMHAEL